MTDPLHTLPSTALAFGLGIALGKSSDSAPGTVTALAAELARRGYRDGDGSWRSELDHMLESCSPAWASSLRTALALEHSRARFSSSQATTGEA